MPELPEVETIRRQMEKELVGVRIADVDVRFGGRVLGTSVAAFVSGVRGATFASFGRRAKLLLIGLSNGRTVVAHLKMTGRFLLVPGDARPTTHVHVVFSLSDGRKLFFEDTRKFGFLKLVPTAKLAAKVLDPQGYGPEPLDAGFSRGAFAACLRAHGRKMIKPLLMDQTCAAGIGNIYADEALWEARVHPERAAGSLDDREIAALHDGITASLRASIRRRGTSADMYLDLYGRKGAYVPELKAYGREGEPCGRCGTPLEKTRVGGRGTHWCPKCQMAPRRGKAGVRKVRTGAKKRGRRPTGRGFTLIELLVAVSIIGMLSTMAVVSYSSARASARDVKRVSDMKQVQTAVELYFENHQVYPYDRTPGDQGLILGLPETRTLSDGGFSAAVKGTPYMITVPRNPQPGGTEYVYRSLNKDGSNCNDPAGCASYAILFTLEKTSGNYLAGPHAMTPAGVAGAEGGYAGQGVTGAGGRIVGLRSTQELLAKYADSATSTVAKVIDNKHVETAANVAAPAVVAMGVANAAAAAQSTAGLGYLLLSFLTQPFLLLDRRKRESWGVVYNSLSKLPVDLAIVRLRDAASGRLVKSTVTDVEGRYSFLVKRGRYRLEAAKVGLVFPSQIVQTEEDANYADVYHGEVVDVGSDGALLTPNIPLDPQEREEGYADVLQKVKKRKVRAAIALIGPVLAALTVAISPNLFTGLLFAAQIVTYMLFRRLARTSQPKRWGIVYEKGTGRAVPQAVLRIFALPYHKLLETQVTDAGGRYHFRVGSNKYYLTATKPGYEKTESEPLDLTAAVEPTVIASNIPLKPRTGGPAAPSAPARREPPSVPPAAAGSGQGNGGTDAADAAGSPVPPPSADQGPASKPAAMPADLLLFKQHVEGAARAAGEKDEKPDGTDAGRPDGPTDDVPPAGPPPGTDAG